MLLYDRKLHSRVILFSIVLVLVEHLKDMPRYVNNDTALLLDPTSPLKSTHTQCLVASDQCLVRI